MYTNHLCMNDTKTELIFITNKKPTTSDIASIQVGDTEVQGKDHVKLLGTILDKKAHTKGTCTIQSKNCTI